MPAENESFGQAEITPGSASRSASYRVIHEQMRAQAPTPDLEVHNGSRSSQAPAPTTPELSECDPDATTPTMSRRKGSAEPRCGRGRSAQGGQHAGEYLLSRGVPATRATVR